MAADPGEVLETVLTETRTARHDYANCEAAQFNARWYADQQQLMAVNPNSFLAAAFAVPGVIAPDPKWIPLQARCHPCYAFNQTLQPCTTPRCQCAAAVYVEGPRGGLTTRNTLSSWLAGVAFTFIACRSLGMVAALAM